MTTVKSSLKYGIVYQVLIGSICCLSFEAAKTILLSLYRANILLYLAAFTLAPALGLLIASLIGVASIIVLQVGILIYQKIVTMSIFGSNSSMAIETSLDLNLLKHRVETTTDFTPNDNYTILDSFKESGLIVFAILLLLLLAEILKIQISLFALIAAPLLLFVSVHLVLEVSPANTLLFLSRNKCFPFAIIFGIVSNYILLNSLQTVVLTIQGW